MHVCMYIHTYMCVVNTSSRSSARRSRCVCVCLCVCVCVCVCVCLYDLESFGLVTFGFTLGLMLLELRLMLLGLCARRAQLMAHFL